MNRPREREGSNRLRAIRGRLTVFVLLAMLPACASSEPPVDEGSPTATGASTPAPAAREGLCDTRDTIGCEAVLLAFSEPVDLATARSVASDFGMPIAVYRADWVCVASFDQGVSTADREPARFAYFDADLRVERIFDAVDRQAIPAITGYRLFDAGARFQQELWRLVQLPAVEFVGVVVFTRIPLDELAGESRFADVVTVPYHWSYTAPNPEDYPGELFLDSEAAAEQLWPSPQPDCSVEP